MKHLILSLLFLFTGLGLSAQCDDFTLISIECLEENENIFTFFAAPPDDWFGVTRSYFVDLETQDTLVVDPFGDLSDMSFNVELGLGDYVVILDREGLCTQSITVNLPEDCSILGEGNGINTVSGRTWLDVNRDGIRQDDEPPVVAKVHMEGADFEDIRPAIVTDSDGGYTFDLSAEDIAFRIRFESLINDSLSATSRFSGDDFSVNNDMGCDLRILIFSPSQTVENYTNRDAGFVTGIFSVTVEDDTVLCSGNCDGELTANATGADEPYTYQWSNGVTSQTNTGLCPDGTYSVTVTGASGCEATASGNVTATGGFEVDVNIIPTSCNNSCDGEATINVTGGTAPYVYDWSINPGIPNATQVVDLCGGDYLVTVTDATGCTVVENFTVWEQPGPNYEVVVSNPISCAGSCDGALTVLNPNGDPITVSWSNGGPGETLTGLCAGTYTAFVTTNDNCFTQVTGTVFDPEPISMNIFSDFLSCGDGCIGELTVNVTAGAAPYLYSWDDAPFSSDPTGTGLCPGEHIIVVRDANGCTATAVGFVNLANNMEASVARQGGDCGAEGGPFSSQIDVSGGAEPYSFTFTSALGTETTDQADGWPDVPPFTLFDVEVTDDEGCSVVLTGVTRERILEQDPLGDIGAATSCDLVSDFLNIDFPIEVSAQQLVLPNNDTIEYEPSTVEVTSGGDYQLLLTSEDGTCLTVTSFTLSFADLPEEIVVLYNQGGCADQSCFTLLVEDQLLISSNLLVTVTTPSNQVITSSEPIICGITEAGVHQIEVSDGCTSQTIFTSGEATTACGSLSGTLYSTPDTDCGPVPGAATIPFTIIRVTNSASGEIYFAFTDNAGAYSLPVPAGDYSIIPLVNGNEPDYACVEMLATVLSTEIVTVDLYSPGELQCPEMDVDICMFQQRRCFQNSLLLYYYNSGNVTAPDAVLTVELDEWYTDITADYPFTQVGQTLIFELGDVPFCQFDYITVNFTISCDAPLGETHCVNASITPDGFCEPAPFWNGSLINITEATCDGDSVRFLVENVGITPTSIPLSYVVVEDGIMMTTQPVITEILDPAEQFEIALLADGSVFQLITNQEPGAPTTNDPSFLVNGCGENPTLGFSNILSLGNGVPWQETICLGNSGSWDPNDKTGYPTGHTGNMIAPGTRLDYNIRFQNTGTDTAFTVVIRDTIGQALDLSTFRIGSSSHRYRMSIDTNRALTFIFDDIQLVDSMTNPLGSQGMVSFSIDHHPDLVAGDLIENKAAIYFDFNEPIITNVSTHMIETKSLPTSLRTLLAQSTTINVFPNPVTDRLSIRLPEAAAQRGHRFVVTDLYGRDLQSLPAERFQEGVSVRELPNGYYFLTLVDGASRARGRTGFVVAR